MGNIGRRSVNNAVRVLLVLGALTSSACTGESGPRGPAGEAGKAGTDGEDGLQGADGLDGKDGTPGTDGKDGKDGLPCTIVTNADMTRTVTCADGTTTTLTNGVTGPQGAEGDPGAPGEAGPEGPKGDPGDTGNTGTSCTVFANLDGSKTISCTDNTSVTILDGKPGAASFNLNAEVPKQLAIEVRSVTIASPPVIEFYVKDVPAGRGAVGLTLASNLRFTIAKLVPELTPGSDLATGNPDHWQSYINRLSTKPSGVLSSYVQATSERTGTLVDYGDGRYSYSFTTNLSTVTVPGTSTLVGYDPTLTHRIGVQMSGSVNGVSLPFTNQTYDFRPAGGPLQRSRVVVSTSSCNECHGKLSAHGSRIDTKYCVTCHNPGTFDPYGETADFAPMIHGIHSAAFRETKGGDEYSIAGHTYGDVTYPQDLRNCLKCHNGADIDTPQANNWQTVATAESCGGCHSTTAFIGHAGGSVDLTDNTQCVGCHKASLVGIAKQHPTEDATPNSAATLAGAASFKFEFKTGGVTVDGSNHPVVTFRVLKNDAPMDLVVGGADLPATTALPTPEGAIITGVDTTLGINSAGSVRWPGFLVAWAAPQDGVDLPLDYNNIGSGLAAAQPVTATLNGLVNNATPRDADGYYTVTLSSVTIPAAATLRSVALQGYWQQALMAEQPNSATRKLTAIARHVVSVEAPVTGDPVRRQIVDSNKCASCHEWFLGHGGSRVYATDVCVMCHVPNLTSSGRGLSKQTGQATYDSRFALPLPTDPAIDLQNPLSYPEESMSFKALIHSIHSSEKRSEPFTFARDRCSSGSSTACNYFYDFSEVTFPGVLKNCETCHKAGTYSTALPEGLLLTNERTSNGVDATPAEVKTARTTLPNTTDLVTTPVSSACVGCHDSDIARSHMEGHGGQLEVARSTTTGYVETCNLCHGKGRIADVATMHAK